MIDDFGAPPISHITAALTGEKRSSNNNLLDERLCSEALLLGTADASFDGSHSRFRASLMPTTSR